MDFSIFDDGLFKQLEKEFNSWSADFSSGKLKPRNPVEEKYWISNKKTLPHNIKRGFIDPYKVPSFDQFPTTQSINNSMSLIKIHLDNVFSIKTKGASVRVYKDWSSFMRQLTINLKQVLETVDDPVNTR